ncbi:coproporphyrinogen III oxidase [Leptothermofonsia sichuanensis E412]|uniref:radical SAM family heme chaperone HemW n=1 Tax=Leptothermofonsia sichuanensis TaxID=2917832 RepID=UPI001CA67596|nr:radical SAM family heme chaperone HemW [Leptothermofonsia sichuanensis]QZZ19873.1 coproporphyrinogen III oxidase [Leptothermofonsia sichuanensis E412]
MPLAKAFSGKAVAPSETPISAPISAYIHIPFCRRRCYYCDFPISVVGDKPLVRQQGADGKLPVRMNGSHSATIAQYIEILCREIYLTPSRGSLLETVFLGGGTPSLLSVAQLDSILAALSQQFGISSAAEISMEIDPATFDLEQLQGYRAVGVNRVSLGVQAFQPQLLAACGRSHTVEDIYQAIDLIHQAGFQNVSLDLISGLPHQTLEHWQDSLAQAIALAPTHLSCYDLTVEAGTPFSRQYKPGVSPLPSDDTTAAMYRLAQKTLTTAGYDHYEISNYAKSGYQCRHNRVYWENRPFYGFGMGATSYLDGDRFARPRKTREYYDWVREREEKRTKDTNSRTINSQQLSTATIPPASSYPPTPDLLLDTLMLGLRLAEGLSLADLEEKFGQAVLERIWVCLRPHYQKGWVRMQPDLEFTDFQSEQLPPNGRIQLTDPEGFLFSNIILIDLFQELS